MPLPLPPPHHHSTPSAPPLSSPIDPDNSSTPSAPPLTLSSPTTTTTMVPSSSLAYTTLPTHHQQLVQSKKKKKLTLIPLIFLIFFEVSGGPFGEEPAVKAGGPLLAILGFLIFPFIWSIPEALITAELSTAFPGNGGYVIWASAAFGPFWGSLMGTSKFLSGVINNAAYPVLCVNYLKLVLPFFSSGLPRIFSIVGSTLLLSFLNYTGLAIVGYTAVALGLISLIPFVLMGLISIPKIKPSRWINLKGQEKKNWNLFLNTLFWNLNFWDNASTLAGEVDRPRKTFPRALFCAGILTCLGYLIPLFAGIGALELKQSDWEDGYLADAAGMIGGKWLKIWVEVGAVLSAIGLYEAQLSSCAYQVLGMADLGILPKLFGRRSRWFNTPSIAILLSTAITLAVSFMDFTDIISSANFLYSLGMLLEFASFLWLRKKRPELQRPYKVPLGLPGLVVMCLVPAGFLVFVMAIATKIVWAISAGLTVFAVLLHFLLRYCKSKSCLEFKKVEQDYDCYDEVSSIAGGEERK